VVAAFPGSADYANALSRPATFTITPATAIVALASSTGPTAFGQPVILTASVSLVGPGARIPTGTVTFYDGSAALAAILLDAAGRAMMTIGSLGTGGHSITAVYGGDADFLGSQSGAVAQSVSAAETRIVFVRHAVRKRNLVAALSLTAEVEPLAPGGGVPTGTIFVMTRKKRLMTADLSNGQVTLRLNPRRVTREPLTIVYGGAAGYRSSTLLWPRLTKSLGRLARASLARLLARPAEHAQTHGSF
jgi:hypothetical protein